MTWIIKMEHLLTARRLSYAWIAGGALWFGWLLSSILGQGNMDMAGHVIGTDYLQFYTAGETLQQGRSAELYNFDFQSQLEQAIAGPGLTSFHAFITPPFLAWLFVPFSYIPYVLSFILWSLLGLLLLWLSLKLLHAEKPEKAFLWSLIWFPVFSSISFGQNSLISLFLFSLTYWLWKKNKSLEAGLISSLLLFKPQMVLGIGILWLLEWRKDWKSLFGLLIGAVSLVGICFWLTPDASNSYLKFAREFLPGLIYRDQFPLWHLHSLRGFWILMFPGQVLLAEVLSLILSIAGIVAFILFWRDHRQESTLLYAAVICLTIWITPHAMVYDWAILLIPAILFWQSRPSMQYLFKPLFALIWIATLISAPLTIGQLSILPVAIQISVPILCATLFIIYKALKNNFNLVSSDSR